MKEAEHTPKYSRASQHIQENTDRSQCENDLIFKGGGHLDGYGCANHFFLFSLAIDKLRSYTNTHRGSLLAGLAREDP